MLVRTRTADRLVLADRELMYWLILFVCGLLTFIGIGIWVMLPAGQSREQGIEAMLAAIVMPLLGVSGALFHERSRCVFDRSRGTVAMQRLRLAGNVEREWPPASLRRVRSEDMPAEVTESCRVVLEFTDGRVEEIGYCNNAMDGGGAVGNLRQAIRDFGLEGISLEKPPG